MLIKLLPEQTAKYWDLFVEAIRESTPPMVGNDGDVMNKLLESALTERLQLWVSYQKGENGVNIIDAFAITTITDDFLTGTKNLLIYCLYSPSNVDPRSWLEGYEAGMKFAKVNGCRNVIAYTQLDYLEGLLKKYNINADSSYRLIQFPVE